MIEKIIAPSEVPISIDDWQHLIEIQNALLLAVQGVERVVGSNVVKGSVFLVGGATYLATDDTAISGDASQFVKLTPSVDGLTLAPSFVANLTGVSWNSTYNGYYDASGNLYVFDELKAIATSSIAVAKLRAIGGKNLGSGWHKALTNPGENWTTILQNNAYYAVSADPTQVLLEVTATTKYFNVVRPCLIELTTGSAGGLITPRYFKSQAKNTPYLSRSDAGQSYCVLLPGHYQLSCEGSQAKIYGLSVFGASSFDNIITEED